MISTLYAEEALRLDHPANTPAVRGPAPLAKVWPRSGVLPPGLRTVDFDGLGLVTGDFEGIADWLEGLALTPVGGEPAVVAHLNVYNYWLLQQDPTLRRALVHRGVMLMDGIGFKLGGLLLGRGWLPDVNGTDLFPRVMSRLERSRARVFCLGAREEVIHSAAQHISQRWPGLGVGWRNGYFGPEQVAEVVGEINHFRPRLLLVGRGFGPQEHFSLANAHRLEVPLIWNVGGLFDFVSGRTPRAPALLRDLRLEWLFRLVQEPRRMWRRNLVAAPWFLWHLLRRGARSLPPECSSPGGAGWDEPREVG